MKPGLQQAARRHPVAHEAVTSRARAEQLGDQRRAQQPGRAGDEDAAASASDRGSGLVHGASPLCHNASRSCLSRSVSIGCQKPVVAERHQLPARRQTLERLALERAVVVEVVEHPGSNTKNPPLIQPSPVCGFSANSRTRAAVERQRAEPRRRPHRRDRRQLAVRAVEGEQRAAGRRRRARRRRSP